MIWFNSQRLMSALIIFATATSMGCASLSNQAEGLINQPAPLTRITMLNGDYRTMDEFEGKHVFMLFWATWCSHSRPAVEDFDHLAQKYAVNPNYVFLAVSVDKAEDLSILKDRIANQQLSHIQHVFSGNDAQDETFTSYYGTIIPYVIAVDPDKTVRVVDTSVSALESYIEGLRN